MILIFMNLMYSCSTYRVITKEKLSENIINRYAKKDKYFIVHESDTAWYLATAYAANNSLIGDKTILPEWHKSYKLPPAIKNNKFDRKDTLEKSVVDEFHVFTNHFYYLDSVRVVMSLDSICMLI